MDDTNPTVGEDSVAPRPAVDDRQDDAAPAACPVCGGRLIEIRAKFHCERCHRICETCCEGGRG
ncbi:MAG: hypothetical protein DWH79_06175 [Planctomycetota bacterium]|nr:MAG: hypothetical protein DWH79_06175 [Planctomycetota bacterium]